MKIHRSINTVWLGILGVVVLCILSRLPQLMSPYLHVDEDECVLGLMANHMALGHEFPFYFWGQHYGFSCLEAGAVAVAIKFFGIGVYSLKVPMLLLWTTGCVFFYCALALWTTKTYSFWITCLLIFSPSWMDWSMKARGGYVTAFLLSNIVLFFLAQSRQFLNKKRALSIGVLLGFILLSQPVSLLGVFPLLIYVLARGKNFINAFICIAGFIGVFILGKVMAHLQANTDFWNPVWFRPDHFMTFVSSSFKERVFNALFQDSGVVSLGKDWAAVILSNSWCVIILVGFGIYIFRLITGKKTNILSTLFLISVLFILACTYFIGREYRYLLSLSEFLVLWFGITNFTWVNKNKFIEVIQGFVVGVLIVLGICVAWNYKNFYHSTLPAPYDIPEMQKISKVIEYLNTSGVKYVFSLDNDLGWKILFFSGEHIISRWENLGARQPAYTEAVNLAFYGQEPVAVVGDIQAEPVACLMSAQEGRSTIFGDQYIVHLGPSNELITDKLQFQL